MKRFVASFVFMLGLLQPNLLFASLWPTHVPIDVGDLTFLQAPQSEILNESGISFDQDREEEVDLVWNNSSQSPVAPAVKRFEATFLELKPLKIFDLDSIDGSDEYRLKDSKETLYIVDGEPPSDEEIGSPALSKLIAEKVQEMQTPSQAVSIGKRPKKQRILASSERSPKQEFSKFEAAPEPMPMLDEYELPTEQPLYEVQSQPPLSYQPQQPMQQFYVQQPMYQPQPAFYPQPMMQPFQQPYYQNQSGQAAAFAMQLQAQAMNMQAQASSLMMQAQQSTMMLAQNSPVMPIQQPYMVPGQDQSKFETAPGTGERNYPRKQKMRQLMYYLQKLLGVPGNNIQKLLLILDLEFDIIEHLLSGDKGQIINSLVYDRDSNLNESHPLIKRAYDLILDLASTEDTRLYRYFVRREKQAKVSKSGFGKKRFLLQMMQRLEQYYQIIENLQKVRSTL